MSLLVTSSTDEGVRYTTLALYAHHHSAVNNHSLHMLLLLVRVFSQLLSIHKKVNVKGKRKALPLRDAKEKKAVGRWASKQEPCTHKRLGDLGFRVPPDVHA